MTIVLFILKIIGVVLLAVLGILLLVILAVLFVPFRYQVCVEAGKDDNPDYGQLSGQSTDNNPQTNGNSVIDQGSAKNKTAEGEKKDLQVSAVAKVHWLLHFLGVEVSFHNGQLDAYLRILFWKKKLLNNEEAKEEEAEVKKDAKATAKNVAEEAVKPPEEAVKSSDEAVKPSDEAVKPPDEAVKSSDEVVKPSEGTVMLSQDTESDSQDDTPEARQQKAPGNTISEEKQKNSKGDGNKKNSSNNNEEKNKKENDRKEKDKEENNKDNNREEQSGGIISRITKLWNDFSNFRKKITRMVEDERNHSAVAHVKAELIRILKAIRPRKLSIDMEFSLGSPDLTGEVLGVCAWFPIFYQKENRLIPNFEADEAYAKGHVDAKGRIYLFQILFAVLRILFDKDCKRMYRMFKKYFG